LSISQARRAVLPARKAVELATSKDPNAMVTPADRLTTLEIRHAEQEKTIEELSGQIAEQWKVIERLEKTLSALASRFLALEEQTATGHEATKPPHY